MPNPVSAPLPVSRRAPAPGRQLLLLALLAVSAGPALAAPALVQFTPAGYGRDGWTVYTVQRGITLERRPVPGRGFYEHRALVAVPLHPESVIEEVWRSVREGDMTDLKRRVVLRESPMEILIYDQIRAPVVKDRDYTIRVRRIDDPRRHRYEVRCETVDDEGPRAAPGHVRIPIVRAGWAVEPDGRGGSRLGYFAYSEPGGLVAAFLARGAQADRSLADVQRMVERLRRVAALAK